MTVWILRHEFDSGGWVNNVHLFSSKEKLLEAVRNTPGWSIVEGDPDNETLEIKPRRGYAEAYESEVDWRDHL